MTIQELHDSLRELVNIGQGQYYPPEVIDTQINTSIKQLYKIQYDHFEATQEITSTLGVYKTTSALLAVTNGFADLPADLYHLNSVLTSLSGLSEREAEQLTDAEWYARKTSSGFAPSVEYPVIRQEGITKIEVLPTTLNEARVLYLRKPATAKYAYTVSESGTGIVYDESNSVQIDWPEVDHPLIQDLALKLLGKALRDDFLMK